MNELLRLLMLVSKGSIAFLFGEGLWYYWSCPGYVGLVGGWRHAGSMPNVGCGKLGS